MASKHNFEPGRLRHNTTRRHRLTKLLRLALLIGLTILYIRRYTYIKAGGAEILFLNPLKPDQESFNNNYARAENAIKNGDTLNAKNYFKKALKYHGSYNEKQRENIYSCANDLWEFKCEKLLKYSRAYELCGQIDNAISCLSPCLTSFEKESYPIDERFFELTVKKIGRQKTIALINDGISNSGVLDCYHCYKYYYTFGQFQIGIAEFEFELAKSNRKKLIEGLVAKYGI
jgi:tetratricopeptide (TPR) repeat protein